MSSAPLWFVGNLDPSITETITIAGAPVNLTGCTVRFRMRAINSAVLKVDQAATIVTPAAGTVRYDWQAADVDTAGFYLCWWQVTYPGGKTQDVAEALIEFRAHAVTGTPSAYVELEDLKSTLELTDQTFADKDLIRCAGAASRAVDRACHRRFFLDADVNQVRYFTPTSLRRLEITDLAVLTGVAIDRTGSGSYSETWTNGVDFVLDPANAAADYRPYERIKVRYLTARFFPTYIEKGVQVTGQFGWTQVPDDVKTATAILAAKLFKRAREAPFGVVTVGIDQGAAMRIARTDPDVYTLLQPYSRATPLI